MQRLLNTAQARKNTRERGTANDKDAVKGEGSAKTMWLDKKIGKKGPSAIFTKIYVI